MNDIPRMLGERYEVGDLLGRGGMAEVHEGRDTRLGRRVAVKMLRTDLARDPVFQARFRREAQSAAGLNHPAIVAVYDTGEDSHVESGGALVRLPYIVMEYVEGRTVRDALVAAGGPLGTDRAATITAGVLAALDYSHRQGIVHRDIKPANVMITPAGDIKVMDFGIARAVADASATMTATSAVIGTAQYLSPEQARGETVDARSDLYSTGCLLYELLTGRPPFVGDSPVAVAYQHVREVPDPPSDHNAAVDDALDRVVLKALAKDREDRYADAEDFRRDLLAAAEGRAVAAPAVAAAAVMATQALPSGAEATRAMTGAGFAATDLPTRASTRRQAAATAAYAGAGLDGSSTTATDGLPPQPVEEEEPRRRGRGVLLVLLLLALFAAAAYAVTQLLGTSGPVTGTVPPVAGQSVEQAKATVSEATGEDDAPLGLVYAQRDQPDPSVPAGTAIGSEPAEGQPVTARDTITVIVSTGPEAIAIPDVSGQTEAQARERLRAAGLSADGPTESVNDSSVEEGQVIRTDPAAGTPVAPGQQITIVVASGEVDLPDLIGQDYTDAAAELGRIGLRPATRFEPTGDAPPNTVIATEPGEGSVEVGSTVTLVIASAPAPVPEPTPTETPSPTESETSDGGDSGNEGNGNGGGNGNGNEGNGNDEGNDEEEEGN